MAGVSKVVHQERRGQRWWIPVVCRANKNEVEAAKNVPATMFSSYVLGSLHVVQLPPSPEKNCM